MTSSNGPTSAGATTELEGTRELLDNLRRYVAETVDDLDTRMSAMFKDAQSATPTFARPVKTPPVRMEQLARTPEPTADLDDLVDLLVPRLVERLVPALREALKADS